MKLKKYASLALAFALTCTSVIPTTSVRGEDVSGSADNVLELEIDENGNFVPTEESQEMLDKKYNDALKVASDLESKAFSWDNATVYFVLTDRFLNSDRSNDHSYGRGLDKSGKAIKNLDTYTNPGTFHGGDIKGLTQKVEEGYFTKLGVDAIWITAPYEQIHGFTSANVESNNAKTDNGKGWPYYSYHGYWTLDYTQMDANMGTAEEFEKFVDACHERGIRVIMDIVMNHVGYTTMKDAEEYGFSDALKGAWESYYYGDSTALLGGEPEADNYWDGDSSVWAKSWWTGFVRAKYPGYTPAGGDDTHMSLSGLPDVITESSATEIELPAILKTKWTKEGRYDQEMKELNDWFASTGHKKQPRYYTIKWLTDWVREYGIDGFRCDTAKHVDYDAWNDLKVECVKALKEWRANNPDKPGAKWTDDFWMTGEAWGHGLDKSPYFTSGGFDSMINFQFDKSGNYTNIESTYEAYAGAINSDSNFNVLSYISSHDDGQYGTAGVWSATDTHNKECGTTLLLAPGAVQIYYGNEYNRGLGWTDFINGSDYLDQRYRTDMDWSKATDSNDVMKHWQKVGTFRNNHVAVGAGQHEKLSSSPYTFSRTYNLEESDEDKVVCALPGKAGTYDINVGDVFEEGETITDAYSGAKYLVSGSSVSVTCDANGVILLEGSGEVKPNVSAKLSNKNETYTEDFITATLKATNAKVSYYSIDDGKKIQYKDGDVIRLGEATKFNEVTTLKLSGIAEDGVTVLAKEYTIKRSAEPEVSADEFVLKVKKSDFATAPTAYVYDKATEKVKYAGVWPGTTMTEDPDDSTQWVLSIPEATEDVRFILVSGGWRSTPDGAKGIEMKGTALYDKATNTVTQLPSGEKGRVTITYKDKDGKTLKTIERVGLVGRTYTTYAAKFEGYKLVTTPDNATGKYAENVEVVYLYEKGEEEPSSVTSDTVTSSEITSDIESSSEESSSDKETSSTDKDTDKVSTEKDTDKVSTEKDSESKSTEKASESKSTEKASESESTEKPTEKTKTISFQSVTTSIKSGTAKVGNTVKVVATTKNNNGEVLYCFLTEVDGVKVVSQQYSISNTLNWKPKKAGTYNIYVYAKDSSGKIVNKIIKNYVVKSKKTLSVTKSSTTKYKVNKKVKLSAKITGDKTKHLYKFAYKKAGSKKLVTIKNYSTKSAVYWIPKKTGTYTIYVYAKPSKKSGAISKKLTVKIRK